MPDNKIAWEQLCEFAESLRVEHELPGMAMGISVGGTVHAKGFGVTNVDHPLDVTENTLFQIGSITKPYTATLLMKLVDEGKIALDTPIQTILPDFRVADEVASATATIFNLLTHTCGWVGDLFTDTGNGDDALDRYIGVMADLEQMSPVGKMFSYNNAAYTVLGRIIEVITEQPYEQAMQSLLFDPLGLQNTFLNPGIVMTHRFAVGHLDGNVARPWPLPRAVAGRIASDVHDLLAFGRFHMGDGTAANGEHILQTTTIEKMQTPTVAIRDTSSMGLSWFIDDNRSNRSVSHGGGTLGQVALLTLVPNHQLALAMLTNGDVGAVVQEKVADKMVALFLDDSALEAQGTVEVDPADYVGMYYRPTNDLIIGETDGQLTIQFVQRPNFFTPEPPPPSPPFKIEMRKEDKFEVVEGPQASARGEFVRADDGSFSWMRMFGRIHKKVA